MRVKTQTLLKTVLLSHISKTVHVVLILYRHGFAVRPDFTVIQLFEYNYGTLTRKMANQAPCLLIGRLLARG